MESTLPSSCPHVVINRSTDPTEERRVFPAIRSPRFAPSWALSRRTVFKSYLMKEPDNLDTLVVHDRIGKGSYGVVYRGVLKPSVRERAVEIAVAAKVMSHESTEAAIVLREVMLQQEAGSHPSIVGVIGCFHHEDSAWLLLELCSTSLHQVLRHRGILEEAQLSLSLSSAWP